ncbi:hypothetical protein MKY37_13915 [Psychrobacillus sp. FSL K6-2836]|uniref:hypothetical protein n=1 Tax=Psychrobacillus sp. FSL K6-2836 TaxID=2921548 RepID=UPI0030FAE151
MIHKTNGVVIYRTYSMKFYLYRGHLITLKISEKSIEAIISQDKIQLNNYSSFLGMMFPYSKVYEEFIFSKKSLDTWVNEKTKNRNEFSKDN